MLTIGSDVEMIDLSKQIDCPSYPMVIRGGKIIMPKNYPTGFQDPIRSFISPQADMKS